MDFSGDDSLPQLDRHSRACPREAGVFFAGIQGCAGVDARYVRAGMTITYLYRPSLQNPLPEKTLLKIRYPFGAVRVFFPELRVQT
jgi:hypothetical protein